MAGTGRVVESTSGMTHFSNPASSAIHASQAPKGSVFATFDVPTSSLQGSGTGASTVTTPNSNIAQRLGRLGRPVPTVSPQALNSAIEAIK